jgi:hypothetical protein
LEESKKNLNLKSAVLQKKKKTDKIKHVGVMSSHFSNEECGIAIDGDYIYT